MQLWKSVLFMLILVVVPLFGQIEIDWTEVPQDIGIMFTHNGAESVTVSLGSPGGPQAWSFTSQPMGSQNTDALIVPGTSTPFGDSFPNSNLVLEITENGYVVYAYGQIAPTFGANLGLGSTAPITTFFRFEPTDSYPIPVVYGASRNYIYGYTLELGPGLEVCTDNYGNETIDAYGSVTVPYGTFECLRMRSFDTTKTTMYVSGIPVSVDTTTHIIYDFLAEDYGLIVHVLSYPDETNTNFTDADFLERITNFSTGINELENIVVHNFSCQPNPFTDHAEIKYSMLDSRYSIQDRTIKIYDATGRLVKSFHLESSIMDHVSVIKWDGTDQSNRQLGGGVYFLRFGDGQTAITRKITLIR
ncbi:MAG: T9SS type A sorting domain-containing protein [bacterium]